MNKALLGKQVWRLYSQPDCLLTKVLRSRCGSKRDPDYFKSPRDASPLWKGLYSLLKEMQSQLKWQVAIEERIMLNSKLWPNRDGDIGNCKVVADLTVEGHRWDNQMVKKCYTRDKGKYILKTLLAHTMAEDKAVRTRNATGNYTVNSGYRCFKSLNEDQNGSITHSASIHIIN